DGLAPPTVAPRLRRGAGARGPRSGRSRAHGRGRPGARGGALLARRVRGSTRHRARRRDRGPVTAIGRGLSLLSPAARRRWVTLVPLSLACAGAEALAAAALYVLIRSVGNPSAAATLPVVSAFGHLGSGAMIVAFTALLACLQLAKNALQLWQTWVQGGCVARSRTELARRALAVYLGAPYAFHLRRNSADLIRAATGAVDEVFRRVLTPAVGIATETLVVLAIGTVLAVTAPAVTLVLVLALGGAGAA